MLFYIVRIPESEYFTDPQGEIILLQLCPFKEHEKE